MNEAFASFLPLILIFVVFYFLLIRPQQKKIKEHKIMIDNLKKGDEVITSGGIYCKISRVIDESKIEVEIANNTKIIISRPTITNIVNNQSNPQNQ